ncbi:MAG: hypothetical protein K0B15_13955 [Lentimicrobium sp.]|nr:hypothetical protein [Lentimicrobium sp.]
MAAKRGDKLMPLLDKVCNNTDIFGASDCFYQPGLAILLGYDLSVDNSVLISLFTYKYEIKVK